MGGLSRESRYKDSMVEDHINGGANPVPNVDIFDQYKLVLIGADATDDSLVQSLFF